MRTIWKYPLEIEDSQDIQIPEGGKILTAQVQSEKLCLWVQVEPRNPMQRKTIEIFGTGHPMDHAERHHIGTIQLQGGNLVFHVYDRP